MSRNMSDWTGTLNYIVPYLAKRRHNTVLLFPSAAFDGSIIVSLCVCLEIHAEKSFSPMKKKRVLLSNPLWALATFNKLCQLLSSDRHTRQLNWPFRQSSSIDQKIYFGVSHYYLYSDPGLSWFCRRYRLLELTGLMRQPIEWTSQRSVPVVCREAFIDGNLNERLLFSFAAW